MQPAIPSAKNGLLEFTIDPALSNESSPLIKILLPVLEGPIITMVFFLSLVLVIHFQNISSHSKRSICCLERILWIKVGFGLGAKRNEYGSQEVVLAL